MEDGIYKPKDKKEAEFVAGMINAHHKTKQAEVGAIKDGTMAVMVSDRNRDENYWSNALSAQDGKEILEWQLLADMGAPRPKMFT